MTSNQPRNHPPTEPPTRASRVGAMLNNALFVLVVAAAVGAGIILIVTR